MKKNYIRQTNRNIVMTKAELNKIKHEAKVEGINQAFVLIGAYLMEEKSIDCDDEKIVDIYKGVERYSEAIDEHLINIYKVCDIIKEYTGMEIKWGK